MVFDFRTRGECGKELRELKIFYIAFYFAITGQFVRGTALAHKAQVVKLRFGGHFGRTITNLLVVVMKTIN